MKVFTRLIATIVIISTLLSTAAFAATSTTTPSINEVGINTSADTNDDSIAPLSNTTYKEIGRTAVTFRETFRRYTTIAIQDFDPKKYKVWVGVYGKNGLLWQEDDCLHDNATSRIFDTGSDVHSISFQIALRYWYVKEKSFNYAVTID